MSKIHIRPIEAKDADDVVRIVREQNLPLEWGWPEKGAGTVAEADGKVIAFCIVEETIYGLVIAELWPEKTKIGLLGMGMLARWIEQLAQRLSTERGKPLSVGGVVRLDNANHLAALKHRGYTVEAEVLSKLYLPQAVSA
jgi:hypothetical protein